ncbi:hypothetical protein BST61_g10512 [Cercospora zeina]
MSSVSRGRGIKASKVVKPKKDPKRTTAHSKHYRFQSFNERIATLKIDPIRRRRHVEQEEKDVKTSHTYFGEALSEWRDTNLSTTFSAFAKEAAPLCDNLPVVLHNENKIVDLLVEYIGRGDALAMDPLFNLLWNLARDLDTRFEKHFQHAVATILAVAARHEDLAVINAGFDCLAWLFKHLSRLLVPDLRPLYDLLAPYMGKEKQKPFIVRYAAEAFAFLVRKAAIIHERESKPLDSIVEYVLKDCAQTTAESTADLHQQGVMAVLSEAIRGVQQGLANGGTSILQSTFLVAERTSQDGATSGERIVCGLLTDFIHFSNQEGFKPVIDVIVSHTKQSVGAPSAASIHFCTSLLSTAVSVRKGSRIADWRQVVQVTEDLATAAEGLQDHDAKVAHDVLSLYAVVLQCGPIGAVQKMVKTLDAFRNSTWAPYFAQFCDMVHRLGAERFNEILLPFLHKFVAEQAELSDIHLLALIARVGETKPDLKLKCSKPAILHMLDCVSRINRVDDERTKLLAHANLLLRALPSLALDESNTGSLREILLKLVKSALGTGTVTPYETQCLILGSVLRRLFDTKPDTAVLSSSWQALCKRSREFASFPAFWTNLLIFIKLCKPTDLHGEHIRTLEDAIVSSLCTASHSIRQDALDVFQELYRLRGLEDPAILANAITIESIPISLEAARSISMNIRRIAPQYTSLNSGDVMQRAIPAYLFGLLHLNLSQAWEDASDALAAICQTKSGDDFVINLAQKWLDGKSDDEHLPQTPPVIDVDTDGFRVFSSFECPNFAKLQAISKQVFEVPYSGRPSPEVQLTADTRHVPSVSQNTRSQALRVLNKIPQVVERRSRLLVPTLLRWAGSTQEEDEAPESDRWVRKEQKALLGIFAQFNNPRVLYKGEAVFSALLALCGNGDLEIQKSALKALLAWKDKSLTRYQEHLENLLDETRFREELSVLLHNAAESEEGEEGIRPEDHSSLMPVLLQLLYGRAVAGGKEGQSGRRKAIFVALSRFGEETLGQFLDIACKPVAGEELEKSVDGIPTLKVSPRQQLGLVNMLDDMLRTLGDGLERFAPKLPDPFDRRVYSVSSRYSPP